MNAKTLYLQTALEVQLEGRALRVKAEDQAERLYPLRQLERIQSDCQVKWHIDALLACARRNILIQFTNAKGKTLARLFGATPRSNKAPGLMSRLQSSFEIPGWRKSYRTWCRGRRLQTLRYVARKLDYSFNESKDLEDLFDWCKGKMADAGQTTRPDLSLKWLQQDLYGLISQILQDKGCHTNHLCLQDPIDLARDLCYILDGILLLVRHLGLHECRCDTAIDRKLTTGWFNQQRSLLQHQIERILNLLELWTIELKTES